MLCQSYFEVVSDLSKFCQICIRAMANLWQRCVTVFSMVSQNCLEVVPKLYQGCIKIVYMLYQNFVKVVSKLPHWCVKIVPQLSRSCLRFPFILVPVVFKCYPCSSALVPSVVKVGMAIRAWGVAKKCLSGRSWPTFTCTRLVDWNKGKLDLYQQVFAKVLLSRKMPLYSSSIITMYLHIAASHLEFSRKRRRLRR